MSNAGFAEFLGTSDEWMRCDTGIGNRHTADDDEATSELAAKAVSVALQRAAARAETLDRLPRRSVHRLHRATHMIGATSATAMDIVVGGTGFVYGRETPKDCIASGAARRVRRLVDRNTCFRFGVGAGAQLHDTEGGRNQGTSQVRPYRPARSVDRDGSSRLPPSGHAFLTGSYRLILRPACAISRTLRAVPL